MKIKKLLAVALTSVLVLAGCGSGGDQKKQDQGKDDAAAKNDKKIVIGVSMSTQANPFFVDVKNGIQKAADEAGIEIIVTDAQDDAATQQKDIENMITKQVNAMIIGPCDSDAIVAPIEACNEAKIPVFTVDRKAKGGDVVAHVGYDAIKSGNLAGKFLADQLGGKGNIVEIQGIMGTNVAQDRSKGFNDAIAEYPDMKKVATQVANFNRAEGMKVMENILQANSEIDGLYCANDEMLLGALEAIEAAKRTDKIVMVGCDALDETMTAIRDGKVNATIAEPPFFLGKAILNTALDGINGKEVESDVILDNQLVTKDNVDDIKTRE